MLKRNNPISNAPASPDDQVDVMLNTSLADVTPSAELHARIMADAERLVCESRPTGSLVAMRRWGVALAAAAALVLVFRPAGPTLEPGPSPLVTLSGGEAIALLSAPVREITHATYENEWAHLRNDLMGAVAYAVSVVPTP